MIHICDTRYPEQCVALAVNVGDEDIILNKSMTLCFVWETDLTAKAPHTKEMDTVNIVKADDMTDAKREGIHNWNSDSKNCHKNTDNLVSVLEEFSIYVSQGFLPKT